jgi:hypothetical protein
LSIDHAQQCPRYAADLCQPSKEVLRKGGLA